MSIELYIFVVEGKRRKPAVSQGTSPTVSLNRGTTSLAEARKGTHACGVRQAGYDAPTYVYRKILHVVRVEPHR